MFSELLRWDTGQKLPGPKEGDLYKVIHLHGKIFEIRYGFYEECDRNSPYMELMEIYPDFVADPQYTDEGIPFVTAIQTPCHHFEGKKDINSTCEECSFYQHGEELLATCSCPANKKDMGCDDNTESPNVKATARRI